MDQKVKDGRQTVGEKLPQSKLTEQNVLKIRQLYSTGNYTQKELGNIFGINHATISDLIVGKTWKHLL